MQLIEDIYLPRDDATAFDGILLSTWRNNVSEYIETGEAFKIYFVSDRSYSVIEGNTANEDIVTVEDYTSEQMATITQTNDGNYRLFWVFATFKVKLNALRALLNATNAKKTTSTQASDNGERSRLNGMLRKLTPSSTTSTEGTGRNISGSDYMLNMKLRASHKYNKAFR